MAKNEKQRYRRRPLEERLAVHLDRRLFDMMRYGRHAVDPKTGQPMFDENGNAIRVTPSAADFAAAIKRLSQLGIKAAPNTRVLTFEEEAERAIGELNLTLPEDELS